MKAFEYSKDVLLVLWVDPDPVILNRKAPRRALIVGLDVDARWIFVAILEGIADQILEYLLQMSRSHEHFRQRACGHDRIAFANRLRQI